MHDLSGTRQSFIELAFDALLRSAPVLSGRFSLGRRGEGVDDRLRAGEHGRR